MDAPSFDRLVQTLVIPGTRRDVLPRLAALPLAGALAPLLADQAEAKRRRKRRRTRGEIVGGRPVPQGTFPFMIYYDNTLYACGGSLITPQYVLTAAHCTGPDGGKGPLFPTADYYVGIGQVNLDRLAPENSFGVVNVLRHPNWDPTPDSSNAFDVELLELNRPVPPNIGMPVRFVGSGDTRFDGAGQPVVVAGWGLTSTGGEPSSILLQTDVDIVSDPDCAAAYGPTFEQDNMICAAFPGRDSCQGDSGGPLFVSESLRLVEKKKRRKRKKRKPKPPPPPTSVQTQVGIVSFGDACASPVFPGVYARISDPAINNFITGVTGL